jgi:dTDP-4-dehydrorhamnose 3,5-epimerase
LPLKASPFGGLDGLLLIEGKSFPDERGYFMESFKVADLPQLPALPQDNLSRTKKGFVRGMHYQKNPTAIGKLIRCIRGKIYDAAIDLRRDSKTYGKWAGLELSDDGNRMLWVPAGFAHGFQALTDEADVQYKVSGYWSPQDERGVLFSDPAVGIKWPLPGKTNAKDAVLPVFAEADHDF